MIKLYVLFDYMRYRGYTIEDSMTNLEYLGHFYYHERPKYEYKTIETYSVEHYYYKKGNIKLSIFRSIEFGCIGHDYWELGNLADLSDVDRFNSILELEEILDKIEFQNQHLNKFKTL